jgi:hypothetical protein
MNPKPSVDPVRWQPPPVAPLPEFGPAELTIVPMPGDAPEDIVVVDRVDGASTFHRLDKDTLKDWLEDYSLGELWNRNILGGRPSGVGSRG